MRAWSDRHVLRRVPRRRSRRLKRQGALPRARKDALFGIRIPEAAASPVSVESMPGRDQYLIDNKFFIVSNSLFTHDLTHVISLNAAAPNEFSMRFESKADWIFSIAYQAASAAPDVQAGPVRREAPSCRQLVRDDVHRPALNASPPWHGNACKIAPICLTPLSMQQSYVLVKEIRSGSVISRTIRRSSAISSISAGVASGPVGDSKGVSSRFSKIVVKSLWALSVIKNSHPRLNHTFLSLCFELAFGVSKIVFSTTTGALKFVVWGKR